MEFQSENSIATVANVDVEYKKFMKSSRKFYFLFKKVLLLFLLFVTLDVIYLYSIWPDFEALKIGVVPESKVMLAFKEKHPEQKIRWTPLKRPIAKRIKKIFIVAEDSRFYSHDGFDFIAIRDAINYNLRSGNRMLGASTISQQTVKNMFLSLSRNPLRKWHELVLTVAIEKLLTKDRILDLYLNVAEMGKGIFGIEAASRYYFAKSSRDLTNGEAIEIAASLPSPRKDNPKTRTNSFLRRRVKIKRNWRVVNPRKTVPVNQVVSNPVVEDMQKVHEKMVSDTLEPMGDGIDEVEPPKDAEEPLE